LASALELEQVTGKYFANSHLEISGPSYDQATAARLGGAPIWSALPRSPIPLYGHFIPKI
jgi:hypothetical protein